MSSSSTLGRDETSPLLATAAPGPGPAFTPTPGDAADPEHGGDTAGQDSPGCGGHVQEARRTPPNMAVLFPAITMGIFLASADGTIALVSYATISSELDALNLASWIMTAYSLALASFQPLYGKLCDIFGRKECLIFAYVLFAVGCLACGLAQSMEQLIAARVLQALGGGGLGTVVSILLTGLVPPEDRGVWQGIVNIVYSLGAGLGAPLGGLIASSVGWRWSFFGQVPLCILAVLLVSWVLDGDIGRVKGHHDQETLLCKLRRVDFLGSCSLIVTIAAFMFGLDRGSNVSWTAPETYLSFLASAFAATWFCYVETRIAREPIVPFTVIFSGQLIPIYLSAFCCFFAITALDFILPLYYQAKKNLSPRDASLYMIPAIVAGVSSAMLTGFWMRRTGQYYWGLMLASVLQITGGLVAFLLAGPVREYTTGLVIAQVISELGVGNAVVSGLIAVISNSSHTNVATPTAAYYSFRNLGSVLGVSVSSSVIQQALRRILTVELQSFDVDVEEIVDAVRKSLDSLQTLDPEIAAIVRNCYGRAMTSGLLLILVATIVAIIPASRIRGGKKPRE